MRLYGIATEDVLEVIRFQERAQSQGPYREAHKSFGERFSGRPLKVVWKEDGEILVVTVYPVRRFRRG